MDFLRIPTAIILGACFLTLKLAPDKKFWENYLRQNSAPAVNATNAARIEEKNLFAGYYWTDSPELKAWEIKEGKIRDSGRTAESFPLIKEDEIRFTKERAWLKDEQGDFFFWKRNIVNDPRLTITWQDIALGEREPSKGNNCLWEIVGEAASAAEQPDIVKTIIDDMEAKKLLGDPTKMTLGDIRWVMIEWSLPLWD